IQNQGDGAEEVGDIGEAMSEVEEMDTGGQLEVALTKKNIETSHQNISPRTLTFQAEVHAVLIEPVKSAKRLASIFTKRKEADISLSPPAPTEHFPPPTILSPKRKSNVVLQEDDLELAVLESASTPKCSQAERKQFMAAFKRPGPDRAKPGKIQAKQKQPTETAAEEEVEEEEATVEPPDTPPDALADVKENTLAKKKTAAKGNRKASKQKKEVTPSSLITPEEGPEAALERTGATATAAGACDASMLPVRRSKREALPRQAAEAEGEAHVRASRRKIKGQMVDLPQEGPLQMSTPKSRHRSKSMYKAHLISPPDKRESPIRYFYLLIIPCCWNCKIWNSYSHPGCNGFASKKKTRAKRLVERAKVIKRQSKKTAMLAEENTSVRRSSRSQAISSKVYVEDEVPSICILVADCRRRRVDLLYSNMHTLLPLPVTRLPVTPLLTPSQPRPGPTALSGTSLGDALNDGSPVKVSQRMRKHKRLAKKDPLHSDSEDDFLSLAEPAVTAPCEVEAVCASGALDPLQPPQRRRNEPLTPQQRAVSGPVSHGLAAIADFLEDMSFMDACSPTGGVGGGRGRGPCVAQRPAQVKDGMVDEARLEDPGPGSREAERAVEIQAAVESMSFQRCRAGLTEAQGESQALGGGELGEQAGLELSLPVADHQRGFSLTPHPPCQPKLLQKCMELLLLSRGVFSTLGSRPQLSLEYLPTLRTICRAEQLKEQGKVKRRFLHYLDLIHLGLSRDTLQHLAGDFP
uniref:Uncharacterized protein n=1 Tax=Gadus morhua TaxID=8049 RepID=A0A8C5FBJ8_GADMO